MRIYQIADLHIGVDCDIPRGQEKIEKLCEFIRTTQPIDELFAIVVLGDIIDCGEPTAFKNAEKIFDYMQNRLDSYHYSFEFLPGNHDICNESLNDFDEFILKYQKNNWHYSKSNSFSNIHNGVNFIYTNSLSHLIFDQQGRIDWNSVINCIRSELQNVLLLHHSFIVEDESNHSDLEHSSTGEQKLIEAGIRFVFHSHTHAGRRYLMSGEIPLIGCGSLMKNIKDMENTNNQFNVIQIHNGEITHIEQMIYIGDRERYVPTPFYPEKSETYADPFSVEKLQYPAVDAYIRRLVLPHSVAVGDQWEQYFAKDSFCTLLDACSRRKRVLLLSDAGMGKSLELQQLALELSLRSSMYYPVLILLEDYDGEDIVGLLPHSHKNLYSGNLLIIFDGYDELNKQLRLKFERKLKAYMTENQSVHILISARSNFCKIELDDKSRTLSDFDIFDLCKLTRDDIKNFISSMSVEPETFMKDAVGNSLIDLAEIPFYLTHMIRIYKTDGLLPRRSELMNRLLDLQLERDDSKFKDIGDSSIEERKHEIKQVLQEIAFAMQLMQKVLLNDENDYQAIFSYEKQKLAKYCGILTKVKDGWKFIHNNFREYLSAQLLNTMKLEDIVGYIAYKDNVIKENWVNTLSYLASTRQTNDILNWLAEYNPNALVKFEKDRIDEDTRYRIFINIFNNYETKNIWFHDPLCNEEELARFAASKESLSFLLEKILHPVHFRSQYTALMLLQEFKDLFGMETQVRDLLLKSCKNQSIRGHECRMVIVSLAVLHLDNDEVTDELIQLFSNTQDDYIRLGMYEYLISINGVDKHVDFLLSGIEYICHDRSGERIGNESYELTEGLKRLSQVESVEKALAWFQTKKEEDPFFELEKVFETLCETAANLYKQGIIELFSFMVKCFQDAAQHFKWNQCKSVIHFFENTNMKIELINYIFSEGENSEITWRCIDELFDNDIDSIDYLANQYKDGKLVDDKQFIKVIQCVAMSKEKFAEYAELVYNKCGFSIPEKKTINYEAIRRSSVQEFFETLFDQGQSELLLNELLTSCGGENLTINQLRKGEYPYNDERPTGAPRYLWSAILHYGESDELASSFFDLISWQDYSALNIMDCLKKHDWLNPNQEQLKHIENRCLDLIQEIDFNTAVTYRGNGYIVSLKARFVSFAFSKYHFEIPNETKLDMLALPSSVFNDKGNNIQKYELLCNGISRHLVSKRVEANVISKLARGDVLADHLEYCKDNRIYSVADIAKEVCFDNNVWLKRFALDYLLTVHGEAYICQNMLSDLEDDLLYDFSEKVWKNRDMTHTTELEKRYRKQPNNRCLRYLIMLNSEFGLCQYIAIADKTNATPSDDSIVEDCTDAIGLISDPALLKQLNILVKIFFRPGFKDKDFGSLYGSLTKAYTLCSMIDFDTVVAELNSICVEMKSNLECVGFCNRILSDIWFRKHNENDGALTIQEVKLILANF
ncbi:metallophosphoesterase [Anoxybacterium hadale]|uniref:metallophosphoesterase n=1 Tax=Anoxybacterium hadale TaxID=3408580 RepID=UPI003AFF89FC